MEELNVIDKLPHYCPVCAYHEWNLDGLVEMIWEYIDVLRIYTKPKVCVCTLTLAICPGLLCTRTLCLHELSHTSMTLEPLTAGYCALYRC